MSFDYQRYLASREWSLLKRQIHERADGGEKCERCLCSSWPPGRVVVAAVHHLTYERVGHELLEDLQAVCKECHAWLSGLSDFDPIAWFLQVEADSDRAHGFEKTADANERLLVLYDSLSPKPVSISDLFDLAASA